MMMMIIMIMMLRYDTLLWCTPCCVIFSHLLYIRVLIYAPPPQLLADSWTSGGKEDSSIRRVPKHRPLQCVQRPGEVVYLPPRWVHATLNVGDAVAAGGQEVLEPSDRYMKVTQ